ncbi:hypothetical protein PEBR_09086 [Penicillium brasilianum]|uniref:Uncharacterized protein n=1 Tax=Penicillium brasilianum TaxID=104259 RepID=A0A1S9S1R6_PENBI|nr:hypothetical protein PEBR_09086 [Penicillium brasilianum]
MKSQSVPTSRNEFIVYLESSTIEPMDFERAREGTHIAIVANTIFFFDTVVLVPFTLFGTIYVYSKSFFTGWMSTPSRSKFPLFQPQSTPITTLTPIPGGKYGGTLRSIVGGLWGDVKAVLGRRKETAAVIRNAA